MYERIRDITKADLGRVKVGDLIRINDWKKPMRVKGVSENYFVMVQKNFGEAYYSVCEKKPWGKDGARRNEMVGGMFHCGTDNMIFGATEDYSFESAKETWEYLRKFEWGEIELSVRTSIPIRQMFLKSA